VGAAVGRETDALVFLQALQQAPFAHDFYHVLRTLECCYPDRARWGTAARPAEEPLRLGQAPDLGFAPSPLAALESGQDGRPPRLLVRFFGLLGPNGPLPLHLTEHVRDRLRNAGDPTTARFLDLFNHRFTAMFYRAWSQGQPHVNRDRPDADAFRLYVGAFAGIAPKTLRQRDSVPDTAKLFHAGAFVRHVRNVAGLVDVLRGYFGVPVDIEEFVGHWMPLGMRERTRLGREGAVLGRGAVLGARVWDRQGKFRIVLGPLTLTQYESFLPGGRLLQQMVDWVRLYFGFELDWDVRLRLSTPHVPSLMLGRSGRLGWTSWLGARRAGADAGDLCLHAETFAAVPGARVP
jgi:type VI secretion system protein ImpH